MRRFVLVVLVGVLVALGGIAEAAREVTVTGEIVGLACKIAGSQRPAHGHCSRRCVKNGQPMGLLTDQGTLYRLEPAPGGSRPYEALRGRIGQGAAVTGKLAEKDGMKVVTVLGSKAAS